MKALNEYSSLSEYIADCQRENMKKHEIPDKIKKEIIANKQYISVSESKNKKSLLGHFIELLLAPFRR